MTSLIILMKPLYRDTIQPLLEMCEPDDLVLLTDAALISTFDIENKKNISSMANKFRLFAIRDEATNVGKLNLPASVSLVSHQQIADFIKKYEVIVWS